MSGRSHLRRTLGGLLAAGLLLALGALSRLPYDAEGADAALLRLSWRIRGERVQECRPLTEEERAALPPHMQREEVCEGRIAPYRLRLRVDGQELEASTVTAAGARQDRPLYVFREIPLPPGEHRLEVSFIRAGGEAPVGSAAAAASVGDSPRGGDPPPTPVTGSPGRGDAPSTTGADAPRELRLEEDVMLAPGQVALVTYDADARALVLRGVRKERR